jgi:putative hydrolase of the HAD superfamily
MNVIGSSACDDKRETFAARNAAKIGIEFGGECGGDYDLPASEKRVCLAPPQVVRYHSFMPHFAPGQTLLIDADDTLWENNVYFERAIAAFISLLDHRKHSPVQVRTVLNEVERETILTHGYGLHSFTHSLLLCFERLDPAPMSNENRERILSFCRAIAEQEIQLLPFVAETLAALSARHRLILMTKGNHAEQADKLSRSGLASYFSTVEIVAEKDPSTYREVVRRHEAAWDGGVPHSYWMIGNSPRSDINPALDAGLNAVHLFHKDTWVLEHATLDPAPKGQILIELDSFVKLNDLF